VTIKDKNGKEVKYIREDKITAVDPVEMDSNLVKIDPKEYNIEVDIRYAKDNNFTCTTKGLKCFQGYKYEFLYLHKDVAKRLKLASKIANQLGYKIIVWDGWRPYEAQSSFYQSVLDDRYFSSPTGIAGHTRGIAIDLGLVDIKTGKVLDFGTDFDSFHEQSNQVWQKESKGEEFLVLPPLTKKQLQNRLILNGIMNTVGLSALQTEWWHFALLNQVHGVSLYKKYKAGKLKEQFVNDPIESK
jgi:D-alanyl-D-alanine dipeptidase